FSAQGIEVIMEDGIQVLADEETIFIVFAQVLFHPLVAGLILAAIMSAIMSTVDSQLLVSSTAVAEDFSKGFFRKKASDKELVRVGRIATVTTELIAGFVATNADRTILDLVRYAWAGFGAVFGLIIVVSLFWRGITRNWALWGIIVGATTVIIWGDFLSGGIFDLYEMVPGFFLNLIVTIVISKMGKPDEVMTDHFDKTMEELHK